MRWKLSFALVVLQANACTEPAGVTELQPQPASEASAAISAKQPKRRAPRTSADRGARKAKQEATVKPSAEPSPRIFALDTRVYIRQRPSVDSPEIGALRIGQGLSLKRTEPEPGDWYAVEPEGYVCLDRTTTRDPEHPLVKAKLRHHARFERDAPLKWGESLEAPIYRRYPTASDQAKSEYELSKHLDAAKRVREALDAGEEPPERALARLRGASPQLSAATAPSFLSEHQDSPWVSALWPGDPRPRMGFVPARSSVSWTDEFSAGGRTWLLTPELTVVPKDRVLPLTPSDFHGIFLTANIKLPIAFMRFEDRVKWRLVSADSEASFAQPRDLIPVSASDDDLEDDAESVLFKDDPSGSPGKLVKTEDTWKRLGHVELTGRARWQRGQRYFETREPDLWIAQGDAALAREWKPRGIPLEDGEKWLDVSIFQGTLVAYVGTRPVFTTLISPGANGYKRRSGPVRKNTTPSGTFRIEWKHTATTMSPDPEKKRYYLTDVPFTQFFHMPFALHAAYWHDRFGEPKSGGCVNLSVADARWLFGWTAPQLPEGWHSVRSGGARGEGTWVRVR